MISAIQQSNCVIPSVKPTGRFSPASESFIDTTSFGHKEKKQKTSSFTKTILVCLVLGAAGGLAALGHKQLKLHKLKKEIQSHYDKAWEYASKGFKNANLQIQKPKLKYYSDPNTPTTGVYNKGHNFIRLNLHKFESMEYIVYKGKGNKRMFMLEGGMPFFDLNGVEKMKKDKLIDASWQIRKATHAEKMFALNATIAHEQRHCVQYHFILDDSEYGPNFLLKDFADKLIKESPHLSAEEAMQLAKKHNPYWANFKPKGNTKGLCLELPTTVNGQNIGFKAKNLAYNHSHYDKTDFDKYLSNTLEVDARTFEIDYLSRKDVQRDCAEDLIDITLNARRKDNTEGITKFILDNK